MFFNSGFCSRSFTKAENLIMHKCQGKEADLEIMDADLEYKCDICPKQYTIKADFESHILTHKGGVRIVGNSIKFRK